MMITVANPIYDAVFKYLLEDERIARTLLSALLKKKVLSVFDQSRKDENSRQIMRIDESLYADDADMLYILHRLTSAAADAKLRQDMSVEDEYFSAIEKRDTEIMLRDKKIEEQQNQLTEERRKVHTLISALVANGMPAEHISVMTGYSIDEVRSYFEEA